jgi:hypothetical protein
MLVSENVVIEVVGTNQDLTLGASCMRSISALRVS